MVNIGDIIILAHRVLKGWGIMSESFKVLIKDEVSDKIIEIAETMAKNDGAHTVTVRRILSELGTTNRVFYNRFHNLEQVLEIVYENAVYKMHKCVESDIDPDEDFFGYVQDVVTNVLISTYDIKKQFARYMFEHDSLTQSNYVWWTNEIKRIIDYGKSKNLLNKDIDADMLSYTIWCFCRGFNTDAIGRNLSKEEAKKFFEFGFGCLLSGIKSI